MKHTCRSGQTIWLIFLLITILLGIITLPARPVQAEDEYVYQIWERVADIYKGTGSSSPNNLTLIGDTLFFRADDAKYGQELWRSDNPFKDAVLVADIHKGAGGSWPEVFYAAGNVLFFQANDGIHGKELWKCEPPYTSAQMVADINPNGDSSPQAIYHIGEVIFFQATDGNGAELWKSGPPYTSATPVADIFKGGESSNPKDLTSFGWILFFTADDSTGRALWRSEPPYTSGTTYRITNNTPEGTREPRELTFVGTTLFFTAIDPEINGREIYKCETPYTSAVRVNEIDRPLTASDARQLFVIGDTLFFNGNIGFSGYEPRKMEPPYNSTNTFRVADVYRGTTGLLPNSSNPSEFIAIGTTLFFVATDGASGVEVWKSVPPYVEAIQAADIVKGKGSSHPHDLFVMGSTLYFMANDGVHGDELWKLEAPYEYETATRLTDFIRGGASSKLDNFTVGDRVIFFTGNDGDRGLELWKIDNRTLLPNTGFAPGVVTSIGVQPAAIRYQQMDSLTIEIPALQVNTSITGVPVSDTGWNLNWLWNQVGYLEGTAFPTYSGNTALTGHAYLPDGTPGPFAKLENLKWGDQIYIHAWGEKYTYEVRSVQRVLPDDLSVIAHKDQPWVTLITCQSFDETTRQYRWRIAVQAVLIQQSAD